MTPGSSFLAFDLGGTRIKAGLVSVADRTIGALETAPTPPDAALALARVIEMARSLGRGAASLSGIGLAVPGLVRGQRTVIDLPGKLPGLVGRDLRGELEGELGLPAIALNDAVAYGLGEALAGAGRSFERVVVMTIGTGVGVAVIQRGAPLGSGALGGGILGGQIPIADGDPAQLDSNGRAGTIEAMCAARRIVDYSNAAGGSFGSVPEVFAAVAAADPAARRGVERFQDGLSRALVALAQAHAPAAIVVGGGPMTADSPLLDGLEDRVRRSLWRAHALVIRPAMLGDAAALIGLNERFARARRSRR